MQNNPLQRRRKRSHREEIKRPRFVVSRTSAHIQHHQYQIAHRLRGRRGRTGILHKNGRVIPTRWLPRAGGAPVTQTCIQHRQSLYCDTLLLARCGLRLCEVRKKSRECRRLKTQCSRLVLLRAYVPEARVQVPENSRGRRDEPSTTW
jgi:hypothetical protein